MQIVLFMRSNISFNNAPSVYVKRIAEGLVMNGVDVAVFCYTKDYSWNSVVINGVKYQSSTFGIARSKNAAYRKLKYYYAQNVLLIKWLRRTLLKTENKAVIDVTKANLSSVKVMLATKLLNTDYYWNLGEHPYTEPKTVAKRLSVFLLAKLSTGLMCNTSSLAKFINHRNCIIQPPTIDYSECQYDISEVANPLFTIGYCGTLTTEKDGLIILLDSIAALDISIRERVRLVIIGDSAKGDKGLSYFVEMAKSKGVSNTLFTGKIPNEKVLPMLRECDLLILTRPDNFQNRYGFPSKLPEYLATGKPVLITAVSDIPMYLADKKNAYLLNTCDVLEISDCIKHIMHHREEANQVGKNGLQVARNVFSNKIQGMKLLDFMTKTGTLERDCT